MAGKSSKKKSKSLTPHQPTALGLSLTRAGMPALDSVVAIFPLAPSGAAVGVTGTKYRIIRTTEVDGYEAIATSQGDIGVSLAAAAPPTGDKFQGTDRKAAKLSIVKKKAESFTDLRPLINSLTEESLMVHHVPKITKDSTMNRVDEEKRNVSVRAFLYAASRENDNDFHLIVGRDPAKTPEMYMKSIGYWSPEDAPDSKNLFIYILEHPSREEAEKNWAAFQADKEWQTVKAESEANGPLVDHIDRYFMDPTSFSALQ